MKTHPQRSLETNSLHARAARRVSVLLVVFVAAMFPACSDDGGGDGGDPDVQEADAGSEDVAADDVGGDTEPDDTGDDDVPDEDAGDEDAPVDGDEVDGGDTSPPPVECPEGEREVGGECFTRFDRTCESDEDCRPDETCQFDESDGLFGTCIVQLPEPMTCPGGPSCPEVADAALRAGFGARAITPHGWEQPREGWVNSDNEFLGDVIDPSSFCDCGRDMICPPGDEFADCPSFGEYVAPDADGTENDGYMQGAWMAGLSHSFPSQLCPDELVGEDCERGVECCSSRQAHDDIWARGFVFEQGETRVGLIVLDVIGFFYTDVRLVRSRLDPALGIDHLVIASTHVHMAPDALGQWGPGALESDLPAESGIVPEWMEEIYDACVEVVEESVENLQEVDLYVAQAPTGARRTAARDSRDPWVFNDRAVIVHAVREGGDRQDPADTVGSIVNWHSHPEALGFDNTYITSDFAHYVREYVEEGLPATTRTNPDDTEDELPAIPGLGGTSVYISGTVGGLLTPLGVGAEARDGSFYPENGFGKANAIGEAVAETALTALAATDSPVDDETLWFQSRDVLFDVVNSQFHVAIFGLELFERDVYNWRDADGLLGPNYPKIRSGIDQIRVGPVTFQTFPGEVFSETLTGGLAADNVAEPAPIIGNPNDTRCGEDLLPPSGDDDTGGFPCLIDPDNPNPPDISAVADETPLYDELPGTFKITVGLGNDEIGYLVPSYDWKVAPDGPFIIEAPGDHYEETNSVGQDALGIILDTIRAISAE